MLSYGSAHRMELELASDRDAEVDSERASAGGLGSIELIEKVKRLEIDLRVARESASPSPTSDAVEGVDDCICNIMFPTIF